MVEYRLLHLIRSVRSQLRSDLKAGSKFIQTQTMDCVNHLSVPLCFSAWEKFKVLLKLSLMCI